MYGAVCCAGWRTTVSAYGACLDPDSVLPKPDVPGLQTASASYGLASQPSGSKGFGGQERTPPYPSYLSVLMALSHGHKQPNALA